MPKYQRRYEGIVNTIAADLLKNCIRYRLVVIVVVMVVVVVVIVVSYTTVFGANNTMDTTPGADEPDHTAVPVHATVNLFTNRTKPNFGIICPSSLYPTIHRQTPRQTRPPPIPDNATTIRSNPFVLVRNAFVNPSCSTVLASSCHRATATVTADSDVITNVLRLPP